ncbi:hypothetical protein V8D89_011710 [Ganoderma adspersum]
MGTDLDGCLFDLLKLAAVHSLNISTTSESESHPAVQLWNVDVMHIIMSYADRRVVSSLMNTCNALNSAGTKYLLEDGIFLRREEGLVSFMWFLWARGNASERFRRITFLKKLTLDFNHPTDSIARSLEALFEILALAAPDFTFLTIWTAEPLLVLHPPLGTAIAKLAKLKTLQLFQTGEHCATLLRTLQSSLVTVKLHFGQYRLNPILLLEGSRSTLESLSTSFALSSPDGPCYANVTHLELSCADLPYIEDYIRAFPNLQSLTSFQYASMRHYQGSLLTLWIWGLTCRIPSVRLIFDQRLGVDPNFLNDIILDVRPLDLSLRLPGASPLLDDAVRGVLSEEDRLQGLELCLIFHINGNDGTVSIGHILDLIIDVVRTSSVSTFKLILDLTWMKVSRSRYESDDGDKELPMFPFEIYLQDMDVDAYADNLLASVASLKEVQVSVTEDDLFERSRTAERRRRET